MKQVLFTKDTKLSQKSDIILSPQFYWIKKIDIPIKSLKDAKKIAPNFFKLDKEKFIFDAIKIENKFFALAFEKNLNLPKKFINSIRLAQIEYFKYECVSAGEYTLKKIDDIIFIFPQKSDCIDYKQIPLSKHKYNLFEKNYITQIALILLILNIGIFISSVALKKEISKLEEKRYSFLVKNSLPFTSFELNSILKDLENRYKNDLLLKHKFKVVSNTPLKKVEFFIVLKYEKKFYIEINSKRNFDFYFKKFFKVKSVYKKNIYKGWLK